MKKSIVLLTAVVLLFCTALPTSAAEPSEPLEPYQIEQRLYRMYMQEKWANYQTRTAMLIAERPDLEPYVITTYEAYTRYYPSDSLFEYVAMSGQSWESLWLIGEDVDAYGNYTVVGDYAVSLGCKLFQTDDTTCYLQYYDGETLTPFPDAYAAGRITEQDLAVMYNAGGGGDVIYRIGDVNKDRKLDVSDMVSLKSQVIEYGTPSLYYGDFTMLLGDLDKNGTLDVADILALKRRIMREA